MSSHVPIAVHVAMLTCSGLMSCCQRQGGNRMNTWNAHEQLDTRIFNDITQPCRLSWTPLERGVGLPALHACLVRSAEWPRGSYLASRYSSTLRIRHCALLVQCWSVVRSFLLAAKPPDRHKCLGRVPNHASHEHCTYLALCIYCIPIVLHPSSSWPPCDETIIQPSCLVSRIVIFIYLLLTPLLKLPRP